MTQPPEFGPMRAHIGFQIHLTWRAIKKRLLVTGRDIASRNSGERVGLGAYSVPILIGLNPGITPQQLARALHLDPSKVALLLKGLEADGLVLRTPSQADKRMVALTLTTKGEDFADHAKFASAIMEDPIAFAITKDERNELVRILAKIRASIGKA